MPNYTSNYNFTKPLSTELYDIEVFNENMEKVDDALKDVKDAAYSKEEADKLLNDKQNKLTIDSTVTATGTNPVNGKAVYNYAQPKVTYSTTDLKAGTSELATGTVYLVYE